MLPQDRILTKPLPFIHLNKCVSDAQLSSTLGANFLAEYADLKNADGHQRVVGQGHRPEREVLTGIGQRVRDRTTDQTRPHPVLSFDPAAVQPALLSYPKSPGTERMAA